MEPCDFSTTAAVPYTLLGLLLSRGASESPPCLAIAGDHYERFNFLSDYFSRGRNAFLWILLVYVTWILISRVVTIVRLWVLGSWIPGPPFSLIFGDSKISSVYGSAGDFTGYLSKLHENYGPLVRLWFGPSQLLVSVKDYALIKEILIMAKDKLPLTGRAYQLAFGRLSLFISPFDKVEKTREYLSKFLDKKFLSSKTIATIIEKSDAIISKGSLDSTSLSHHLAFNILGTTIFGESFLNWKNNSIYEELISIVAKDGCFWASHTVTPFWKLGFWQYQSLCKKLKHLTREIIHLSLCNDNAKEICLKEEECGNLLGLMLHGNLNMANLISSILIRLVLYPGLQEQIYSEIIAMRKLSCEINTDNVKKMQFLLATVCESARLVPVGPFLQRCSLKDDITLESSITIPAGAMIVIPLNIVQMDASIWGDDALQFNPHRFLSSDMSLEALEAQRNCLKNKMESFLTFGSGARACLGQKFVILGIATLIVSLLHNYEIRFEQNATKEAEPAVDSSILHHIPSSNIVFTKRNNSNVNQLR